MGVSLLDLLALYIAVKAVASFGKTKRNLLLLDSLSVGVFAFAYLYCGYFKLIAFNSKICTICIFLLVLHLAYLLVNSGNKKGLVIIFTFILVLSTFNLAYTTSNWVVVVFNLPLIAHVLACDCSDVSGYTTLNVGESILYLICAFALQAWLAVCTCLIYIACSSLCYLKVNKLSALQKKKETVEVKPNRATRREQEREARRKGKSR